MQPMGKYSFDSILWLQSKLSKISVDEMPFELDVLIIPN